MKKGRAVLPADARDERLQILQNTEEEGWEGLHTTILKKEQSRMISLMVSPWKKQGGTCLSNQRLGVASPSREGETERRARLIKGIDRCSA